MLTFEFVSKTKGHERFQGFLNYYTYLVFENFISIWINEGVNIDLCELFTGKAGIHRH